MVFDIAGQALCRKLTLGAFMDFVDPCDAFPREHAQDVVGVEHAIAEGHAKGDGFSRDGVLCIHLARRDNVLDLSNERIIEPFVGIEIEHPVGTCLLECKIALCREVICPGAEADLCTVFLCQGNGLVSAA